MRYVCAIDGGGTKTDCILCDDSGNILGWSRGGSANYQLAGMEAVKATIASVIREALNMAGLVLDDISYAFMGMAGADSDKDHMLLSSSMGDIFGKVPYEITNDCWIALSGGAPDGWGAVSVCGTGNNAAIKDEKGNRYILRALQYEFGNYGGGNELIREALHYAFRSDEGTGMATRLETRIPQLLHVADMQSVCDDMYANGIDYDKMSGIVKLVFELANEGDAACQEILIKMGRIVGEMLGGFIERVGLHKSHIPIVLAGSLYNKAESMLLRDSLILTIRKKVPDFTIILFRDPPVIGSAYEALKRINAAVNNDVIDNIKCNMVKYGL